MSERVDSIFASFAARSQISSTSLECRSRSKLSRLPSRMEPSEQGGTKSGDAHVAFLSSSQCRGRMALAPSIVTSGMVAKKSLHLLSTALNASHQRVHLWSALTAFNWALPPSSSFSASISAQDDRSDSAMKTFRASLTSQSLAISTRSNFISSTMRRLVRIPTESSRPNMSQR